NQQQNQQGKSDRGFSSMDQDQQREKSRKGGEGVSTEDRSLSKDSEISSDSSRKGSESRGQEQQNQSRNQNR
ncbi:MAG: hypothetical protein NDI61_01420, partial [Bdellovibrionaceae bacterium]|nr:hypothetical protein [Pseudobdellovibrionaceae bacterium]